MSVAVTLPDGKSLEFETEPSALEVAQRIGPRLAKDVVGVQINGGKETLDLRTRLASGTQIRLLTLNDPEATDVMRHSGAHIMAQAVQNLWPEVKVTIGPVIDNGFFYDFDSPKNFSEEDFASIEKEISKIVQANYPIEKEIWPTEKAIDTFRKMGERFKVEIIEDLKKNEGVSEVSIYHQGPWFDLCRGPHLQRTGQLKAFKLLSVAGAYWRGDEKNPMLQRIYATAFRTQKELDDYLHQIEEAKKRDHRKLGKELGLTFFHEWAPGSPFFTAKGATVYHSLQAYIREIYVEYGYEEVITPQLFDVELFKVSGHYNNYDENMYFLEIEGREFGLKPMNCPSHCLLYGAEKRSYRDLPLRMADFGRLHRFERSGALHGLTRVRSMCQDDAHVFTPISLLQSEIERFMAMLQSVYETLGMPEYSVVLATRPANRMGSDEVWDQSEKALSEALVKLNIPFRVSPGDGAFYGPKLEIHFVDAIKRSWQVGTLQLDYILPENFDLKYTGEDNHEHRPVMLHRAILGTFERFIGVYLEHVAGHLPAWLAPVQVRILNVTDRVNDYAETLLEDLKALNVRADFDRRSEKLNYKIRLAQLEKIPYMIILGDQEMAENGVTVRLRSGQSISKLSREKAQEIILSDIKTRSLQTGFQQLLEANQSQGSDT